MTGQSNYLGRQWCMCYLQQGVCRGQGLGHRGLLSVGARHLVSHALDLGIPLPHNCLQGSSLGSRLVQPPELIPHSVLQLLQFQIYYHPMHKCPGSRQAVLHILGVCPPCKLLQRTGAAALRNGSTAAPSRRLSSSQSVLFMSSMMDGPLRVHW